MTETIDTVALCRTLEQALRAGFSLRQAMRRATEDFADPRLGEVARHADDGAPLDHLLDDWSTTEPDIGLLAATIRLQLDAGGNLADRLSLLADILERRQVAT
jgi:Flp pilus assembly protein TadB